ncbi:hypothetical protein [Absidia glauca]|uniref:Uncharacterized protein n=1 Tax=Absidia glauca TaxID=4829 RepID=A0A163K6U7_ABSGL|nr:hypothetical protein [Absidia glauca]
MARKNAAQRRKQKAANKKVTQHNDTTHSTVDSSATHSITDGATDPQVTAAQQLPGGTTPVQETVAVDFSAQVMENTAVKSEETSNLGQVEDHETTKVVEIKEQLATLEADDINFEETKKQQPTPKVDDIKIEDIKEQQPIPEVDDVETEEIKEQQPTPKVDDIKIEDVKEQQPAPKVDEVKGQELTFQKEVSQTNEIEDQLPTPKAEESQADEIAVDWTVTSKTEQHLAPVEQLDSDQVPNSTLDNDDLKSSEKTASVDNVATTNGSEMKNKSAQKSASPKRKSLFGLFKKEKTANKTVAKDTKRTGEKKNKRKTWQFWK